MSWVAMRVGVAFVVHAVELLAAPRPHHTCNGAWWQCSAHKHPRNRASAAKEPLWCDCVAASVTVEAMTVDTEGMEVEKDVRECERPVHCFSA